MGDIKKKRLGFIKVSGDFSIDTPGLLPIIEVMDKGRFSRFVDKKIESLSDDNIKRIIRAMETETERFRHILGRINEGLMILSESGHILYANEKGKGLLGLETGRKNISDLILSDGSRLFDLNQKHPFTESRIVEHQDSFLHLIIEPVSSDGVVFVYIRDISDLYHARRLLLDNIRSTGQLVTLFNIHVNDPLSRFRLFLDLLPGESSGISPEQKRILEEDIDKIDRTLHDLTRSFTSNPYVFKRFYPEESLRKIIRSRQFQLTEKKIRIRWDLAGEGKTLYGNPDSIEEALGHILDNALEATPEKGSIMISTRAEQEYFLMIFRDEGPALSREGLRTIFDPFAPDSAEHPGLGLSVAARILAHHLGSLNIKSRPGEGRTFTLLLPRRDENQPSLPYTGEAFHEKER